MQIVKKHALQPLNPEAVKTAVGQDVQILDIRSAAEFADGFVPGSINIGIDGMFAIWVEALIQNASEPLILVGSEAQIDDAMVHLGRIGYQNVVGFLDGGLRAWERSGHAVDRIETIDSDHFSNLFKTETLNILDCRTVAEFDAMHVAKAVSFPLSLIKKNLPFLDKKKIFYIHCKSGYRSMAAASILRKHGIEQVIDIHGGFDALLDSGVPTNVSQKEA